MADEKEVPDEEIAEESLLPDSESSTEPVDDVASEESPVEAPEAAAAEQEIQSLRDAAAERGFDLSKFKSDDDALEHLVTVARQAEESRSQLSQYQQMVQQMMAQQQRPREPEPELEKPKLWDPPEFNPVWFSQVRQDDQGNLIPANGGTQETVAKLQRWAQFRQEQQEQFWNDPFSYMRPFIEQIAEERASTNLRSYEEQTGVRELVSKNAEWLFTDGSRTQFSDDGKIFYEAAQKLSHATPNEQYEYAMAQVNNTRLQKELESLKSKSTAMETHEQKKKAAVSAASPNSSGTLNTTTEQNPDLPLRERLLAAFKAKGITSEDLAANYR